MIFFQTTKFLCPLFHSILYYNISCHSEANRVPINHLEVRTELKTKNNISAKRQNSQVKRQNNFRDFALIDSFFLGGDHWDLKDHKDQNEVADIR